MRLSVLFVAAGVSVFASDVDAAGTQAYSYSRTQLCSFNDQGQVWAFGYNAEEWSTPDGRAGSSLPEEPNSGDDLGAFIATWNADAGEQLTSRSMLWLANTRISPDGRTVAEWKESGCECTGPPDGKVRLYDTGRGNLRATLVHDSMDIHDAVFSADCRTVVISYDQYGSEKKKGAWLNIRGFDVESGKQLYALAAPPENVPVCHVCMMPDGKSFAAQNENRGAIEVRDFRTGRLLKTVADDRSCELDQIPAKVSLSPDGTLALLEDGTSGVVCKAGETNWLGNMAALHHLLRIESKSIRWTGPGHLLAADLHDAIIVYDAATSTILRRHSKPEGTTVKAGSRTAPRIALSGETGLWLMDISTGKLRQIAAGRPAELVRNEKQKYEREKVAQEKARKSRAEQYPREEARFWTFLQDGRLFVYSGTVDGENQWVRSTPAERYSSARISIWDVSKGKQLSSAPAPITDDICVSPDGRFVCVWNSQDLSSRPKQVKLLNTADGSIARVIQDYCGGVGQVRFSPDSAILMLSGQPVKASLKWRDRNTELPESLENLRGYETATGKPIYAVKATPGFCSILGSDTVALETPRKHTIALHDLRTGRLQKEIVTTVSIYRYMNLSHDGKLAAGNYGVGRVPIFDPATLNMVRGVDVSAGIRETGWTGPEPLLACCGNLMPSRSAVTQSIDRPNVPPGTFVWLVNPETGAPASDRFPWTDRNDLQSRGFSSLCGSPVAPLLAGRLPDDHCWSSLGVIDMRTGKRTILFPMAKGCSDPASKGRSDRLPRGPGSRIVNRLLGGK